MRESNGRFVILDVVRLQGGPHEVETAIANTAGQDGPDVTVGLPQDPGLCIVRARWNTDLLEELGSFPTGAKDDQVDALSRAFGMLTATSAPARTIRLPLLAR